MLVMSDDEILRIANEIVAPHNLRAELFDENTQSVGGGGDHRTVSGVICLVGDQPDDDTLATLSAQISNRTPINRVTRQLAVRQ